MAELIQVRINGQWVTFTLSQAGLEPGVGALQSARITIPLVRETVHPLGLRGIGAEVAALGPDGAADEHYELGSAMVARVTAGIAASTCPVGTLVAAEVQLPDGGAWVSLDGVGGPVVAIDAAAVAAAAGGVLVGEDVTLTDPALADLRIRAVTRGGDGGGELVVNFVSLQPLLVAPDIPPPPMPPPIDPPTTGGPAVSAWVWEENFANRNPVGETYHGTGQVTHYQTQFTGGIGDGGGYMRHVATISGLVPSQVYAVAIPITETPAAAGTRVVGIRSGAVQEDDPPSPYSVSVPADGAGEIVVKIGMLNMEYLSGITDLVLGPLTVDGVEAGPGGATGGCGEVGEEPCPPPDPPPDPPGPPPLLPLIYGAWAISESGSGPWNSTIKPVAPNNVQRMYQVAKANHMRILPLIGGPHLAWEGGNVFRLPAYLANVRSLAGNPWIAAGIADGTFPICFILDEPNAVKRYGRAIGRGEVQQILDVVHAQWPGWPTAIRQEPLLNTAHYNHLTYLWGTYRRQRGEFQSYVNRTAARCTELGHNIIWGMNVIDFGGSGAGSGVLARWSSAADLLQYGIPLADRPEGGAFYMWRYEAAWYNQPGVPAALLTLRNRFAASRP